MATTTDLSTLKINYLTQEQYDTALANGQINSDELYLTPSSPIDTQILSRPKQLNGLNDNTLQTLVSTSRADRLMFLPADQIIIEKTTNGGSTWTDAGISDTTKTALFSETRPSGITIPLLNSVKNVNCGLRITITAMKYNVPSGTAETAKYNYWNSSYISAAERYSNLKELYLWVNTNSDGLSLKVEAAKGNASTTWVTVYDSGSNFALTGWAGCDYIKFSQQQLFGGSTSQTGQYWNYRFTFFTRNQSGGTTLSTNSSYTGTAQSILEIRGYGDSVWRTPNNFMANDHIYTWDQDQNVTFPASVYGSTPNFGTNDNQIATTAFVQEAVLGWNIKSIDTDYTVTAADEGYVLGVNANVVITIPINITKRFFRVRIVRGGADIVTIVPQNITTGYVAFNQQTGTRYLMQSLDAAELTLITFKEDDGTGKAYASWKMETEIDVYKVLNRSSAVTIDAVNRNNTADTTTNKIYMVRGEAFSSTETTPTYNGQICWTIE